MHSIHVALKYFTIGLLAGLFIAPRAGQETRALLAGRLSGLLDRLLGAEAPTAPVAQPPDTATV